MEVRASIDIAASARAVWSVLTDLPRFGTWNPFIRAASGSTDAGETVRVRVRSSFGLPLVFHATVLDSEADRELHWRGYVVAPWLACGEHWFTIEPIDSTRVRFVQRERFTGVVPRLAARLLAREVKRGFDAMNEALAARAQSTSCV
jgi:hypothetical protein